MPAIAANSARGAARFAAEAIGAARAAGVQRADRGAGGLVVLLGRVLRRCAQGGARFSVTVNMDPKVTAAIATIPEQAWTPIRYPQAIWDDQIRCWVSDAQVAETEYTTFTSKKGQEMTARLIVRRVRDLNKKAAAGQDELFPAWRYHAVFTDPRSSWSRPKASTATARSWSRSFADWTDGPLAHLPYVRGLPRQRGLADLRSHRA